MSLQESDDAAAAHAVAPRVTLAALEAKVTTKVFGRGSALLAGIDVVSPDGPLELLTLCVLITENGFTVVGKSACASPENFNAELGETLAYEDALRQLWSYEGYLLRERLTRESEIEAG